MPAYGFRLTRTRRDVDRNVGNYMFKIAFSNAVVALALLGTVAFGGETLAAEKTPDQLAKTCAACHPKKPKAGDLSIIPVGDIADKLKAYRSGAAKSAIMNGLTRKLSDAQITGVAALVGMK